MCTGEYHGLFLEIFDMGAFGEEFGHIAYLMAGLLGEAVAGAGQNCGTHEHGHVGQVGGKFLHQGEVLCAVIHCGYVNLQNSNINITQIIIVTLWRVANEKLALRVIMLQPIFQGSAYEATSDNSNVNHCIIIF